MTHEHLTRGKCPSCHASVELTCVHGGWQTIRNAALEEAAKLLDPTNPRNDWTEYALDNHRRAERIRTLKTPPQESSC